MLVYENSTILRNNDVILKCVSEKCFYRVIIQKQQQQALSFKTSRRNLWAIKERQLKREFNWSFKRRGVSVETNKLIAIRYASIFISKAWFTGEITLNFALCPKLWKASYLKEFLFIASWDKKEKQTAAHLNLGKFYNFITMNYNDVQPFKASRSMKMCSIDLGSLHIITSSFFATPKILNFSLYMRRYISFSFSELKLAIFILLSHPPIKHWLVS